MTKEEAAIKQELLEGAVDELNSTLLADCKDKIGKDSGQEMIEELKEASVEIDQDDEFTKATADVLRALGVKAKFKVKKEKKKKGKAVPKAKGEPKSNGNAKGEVIKFMSKLFGKGTMNRGKILDKCTEQFPEMKPSTFSTLLSDSKNPRYNKFAFLVEADEKGKLSFGGKS